MKDRITKANRVTWAGLFVNIVLTSLKLAAGLTAKSGAMVADAFHSLSDFATDIVVLIGFRFIAKPVDKSHDYGHGKVETLSSVIIGVMLLAIGLKIFCVGGQSIVNIYRGGDIPEPGKIAFYAAILSIITKEWLYRYTVKIGKAINSQAVVANAWHHRSDAFSSVGTMLGIGGAIWMGEAWRILDPIAAVAVSFFIIKTAINSSLGGVNELLEASLGKETEDRILDIIRSVPGVLAPHDLKTRRIGNYIAIDLHIEVDKNLRVTEAHHISTDVEDEIKKEFGEETFISVHIEPKER